MVQQVEALLILDGKINARDLSEGFDDAFEVGSDGVVEGGLARRTLKGQAKALTQPNSEFSMYFFF